MQNIYSQATLEILEGLAERVSTCTWMRLDGIHLMKTSDEKIFRKGRQIASLSPNRDGELTLLRKITNSKVPFPHAGEPCLFYNADVVWEAVEAGIKKIAFSNPKKDIYFEMDIDDYFNEATQVEHRDGSKFALPCPVGFRPQDLDEV